MKQGAQRGIFERPPASGIWWISYFDAVGKWHREKVGRRSIALDAYYQRKREIREGKFVPPDARRSRMTFRDLCERALAQKKTRVSASHAMNDDLRAKKILAAIGDLELAEVTSDRIDMLMRELAADVSGSTVNRYRSQISTIFAYGVRSNLIAANPVARVPKFKEGEHRIRFLDKAEELALRKTIRKECPDRMPELDLALNTGMRRGEQFGLRWLEVDLERGILTVRGKNGRRVIPVNSVARAAIDKLRKMAAGSEWVCRETKSSAQRDWRRWFETAVRTAEIHNFRWHDLRHTFASRLVMAGVDIRTVSELLGHKSITMTMRYAHLSPDHQKDAIEKLVKKRKAA
jgi:site-specific recombinase XerD